VNSKSIRKSSPYQLPVNAIFLDYDGTISPSNVSRGDSKVAAETRTVLERLGERIPIAIVTSKDPWFVVPRTPFAEAWSTISGLDNIIGEKSLDSLIHPKKLELLGVALKFAQLRMPPLGIEVEEKRNSKGQLVAFCVDWRLSTDEKMAETCAKALAIVLKDLSLTVKISPGEPFFDVYAKRVDKGKEVRRLRRAFGLTGGVLFMGDSKADNPAFLASDVSVGVINNEGNANDLVSDYSVSFGRVSEFLCQLFDNHLFFDSNFACLSPNRERVESKNE
jgi:hydroxymethylpyrimidine pyrophosphatase-like HAD family hydrolase